MKVILRIEAELQHITGKFAGREEVAEDLIAVVEDADPGEVAGVGEEGDTAYEITDWQVSAMEVKR